MTPTQKKKIRTQITNYCLRAERNERHWHYTQQRPFRYVDDPDSRYVTGDCSAYVSMVFRDAMHETGIFIADPLGYRYTGYGYTGTLIDWLQQHGKKVVEANGYLVGDIAINGNSFSSTNHTFLCRKAGSAKTSVWSSFGNENAPDAVSLNYHPSPLLGVWRHPALL